MANSKEAGIIGPSQAEAAIFNELTGPIRESRKPRILAGIAAVLGIPTSMALIAACAPQRPAEVRSISTPTATPTEIPPTATASPTPEPPKPTATTEPTKAPPTPTKEATPIPKPEKSPLPTYGVFIGNFTKDEGMIVVASIPETETSDSILVYFMRRVSNGLEYMIFKAKAENIQDGTFRVSPSSIWKVQAKLDNTGKTLSGKVEQGRPGAAPTWESDFQADLTGTGKANVITAIKKAKATVSRLGDVDLSQVKLDELKERVDLDRLPQ